MRALCHVDAFSTSHTCNLKLNYQVLIAKVLHFITINGASQVLHYERRWCTSTKESKYTLTRDYMYTYTYYYIETTCCYICNSKWCEFLCKGTYTQCTIPLVSLVSWIDRQSLAIAIWLNFVVLEHTSVPGN